MLRKYYTFILIITFISPLYSQTNVFSLRNNEIISLIQTFSSDYFNPVSLNHIDYINGTQYLNIRDKYNHPYLGENEWMQGKILYNNKLYVVDKLKYDIQCDKIVLLVEIASGSFIMLPVGDFISEFYLSDKHFIKIDSIHGYKNSYGYFECVYEKNDIKLLLKHSINTEYLKNETFYTYHKTYKIFLENNGNFMILSGKHSILSAFEDKKKTIKDYMSKISFVYSKYNLQDIIKVIDFYNGII
jgi:hypothetical protein